MEWTLFMTKQFYKKNLKKCIWAQENLAAGFVTKGCSLKLANKKLVV